MGRLLDGSLILLFYILVNVLAAFITSGAESGSFTDSCSTANNVTSCESGGRESFFDAVADVTVSGFDGAPPIVNILWLLVGVFLLSLGVLLIVVSFIPTTSE